ncbi:bifunctional 2-C-methyl-D-erythritol 4-phosphate cytidylyltransferase/2-C-methyl-D-erythritol 2,4-cyclodiphosphate synthase [Aestuariivirga litoralis]|uniref:bifunctional 2-C-methyl-D-erythritol 4-phosphate cytidylyltransferase/2-C-methyl-D-erythritol 2,4-cyclodiphosphate synthase n=1 Tax=Aestuariivirga litoralis TaxID=2650924 RepID=UPI0032B1C6FF
MPKQYQLIGGKPVLRLTLEAFATHPLITKTITVIGEGHDDLFSRASQGLSAAVRGGSSRQESCRLGIEACVGDAPDLILIHDAARPFVSHTLISAVIAKLGTAEAVIPALPVADTIKEVKDGVIGRTLDRSALYHVQTPQGFHYAKIRAAHERAAKAGENQLTDDAAVAEAAGMKVHIVPGDPRNRKLTTAEDIAAANRELDNSMDKPDIRVGSGMDFHVFEVGNAVWLCGVEVPHSHKLKGHSDADVALHALTDALLGTIGEGDIGTHFPPSDPQWKNAKSAIFVAKARALLEAKGGVIANVDITILAEAPKISPHIPAMKAALVQMLGISADRIAIKATTTEKMGAIGRKEGMAAMATATVRLP